MPSKSQFVPPGWTGSVAYFPSYSAYAFPGVGAGSQVIQRQYNFVDTLSKTVGAHQLKFGVDYRRMKPTQQNGCLLYTSRCV